MVSIIKRSSLHKELINYSCNDEPRVEQIKYFLNQFTHSCLKARPFQYTGVKWFQLLNGQAYMKNK